MKDQIKITGDRTVFIIDDREVSEAEYRKRYPLPDIGAGTFAAPGASAWRNFYSDALAVHPKDIAKAEAEAKAKGVSTEFEPEAGRPQFRDRDHRRRYMKAFGFHDRNGGYGDG